MFVIKLKASISFPFSQMMFVIKLKASISFPFSIKTCVESGIVVVVWQNRNNSQTA